MKVIVPVAGEGTRLRPHTFSRPKSLLRMAGKRVLDFIVEPLEALEPDEVIFVIGYKGEMIRKYAQSQYPFAVTFVHQDELLGMGYGVFAGLKRVADSDSLLVLLGDSIIDCDFEQFISSGDFVLGQHPVADPERFGIIDYAEGKIVGIEEKSAKPKSSDALIGLYYFDRCGELRRELEGLLKSGKRTAGEVQLTDALDAMIKRGVPFSGYKVDRWYDCGSLQTMLATAGHILSTRPPGVNPDGSHVERPVFVHESARVEESQLGPNVSVEAGAVVRRSNLSESIIGAGSTVENCRLSGSIIGDNCVVRGLEGTVNIGDSSHAVGR